MGFQVCVRTVLNNFSKLFVANIRLNGYDNADIILYLLYNKQMSADQFGPQIFTQLSYITGRAITCG